MSGSVSWGRRKGLDDVVCGRGGSGGGVSDLGSGGVPARRRKSSDDCIWGRGGGGGGSGWVGDAGGGVLGVGGGARWGVLGCRALVPTRWIDPAVAWCAW